MSTITSMASLVASDRSVPEDEVLVVRVGDDAVFAVADGTGGLGGGRRAAGIVIEAVQERLHVHAEWLRGRGKPCSSCGSCSSNRKATRRPCRYAIRGKSTARSAARSLSTAKVVEVLRSLVAHERAWQDALGRKRKTPRSARTGVERCGTCVG
jgi:serine/threonine protein phosphatase PrpC